ncbi:hypothetical protein SmJEL517_g04950 [Synchytrium microbalum]|uniref:Enoyl-CoA hydratase n=1 Tax=Synchytrium microbalum TaxID=1806994 RepID=A0A507C1E9_9FUNG|nr:uncharacterized protein SmJEL517_g04950 [Synchytrium microbalum]TPX31776.1 hypothetical protein SmJEL517_g04950 [Synchytrium microbalum]
MASKAAQLVTVTFKNHVSKHRGATGKVATVTVNNERRLNVMNSALMKDFIKTFQDLSMDPELRCVVLTGAGNKSFIGGADISEMYQKDQDGAEAFIRQVSKCADVIRKTPVPVIGRVNGWCLGAGLEVAAACDFRISADTGTFGMPEVRVGLPSVVEACLLPDLIGWGRTRYLLLVGDNLPASTMQQWGFLENVVPLSKLDDAVNDCLDGIVASGPRAVKLQKELITKWERASSREAATEAGAIQFRRAYETKEPQEYMDVTFFKRNKL